MDEIFAVCVETGMPVAGMKELKELLETFSGGPELFKQIQRMHRARNLRAHPGRVLIARLRRLLTEQCEAEFKCSVVDISSEGDGI